MNSKEKIFVLTPITNAGSPNVAENGHNRGALVWFKEKSTNLSKGAIETISASWKDGTKKQQNILLKEFSEFCAKRNEDLIQATVEIGIDFLTEYCNTGISNSSVNSARNSININHQTC